MDTQSSLFNAVLDPTMVIAVAAIIILVGSIVRDWHDRRRKRADPKVITLSAQLGAYRPNHRLVEQSKLKP